jgi:hypothetical protein
MSSVSIPIALDQNTMILNMTHHRETSLVPTHHHGDTEISLSRALQMPVYSPRPAGIEYDVQIAGQPSLGQMFDHAVQRQLRTSVPTKSKWSWCVIL